MNGVIIILLWILLKWMFLLGDVIILLKNKCKKKGLNLFIVEIIESIVLVVKGVNIVCVFYKMVDCFCRLIGVFIKVVNFLVLLKFVC